MTADVCCCPFDEGGDVVDGKKGRLDGVGLGCSWRRWWRSLCVCCRRQCSGDDEEKHNNNEEGEDFHFFFSSKIKLSRCLLNDD